MLFAFLVTLPVLLHVSTLSLHMDPTAAVPSSSTPCATGFDPISAAWGEPTSCSYERSNVPSASLVDTSTQDENPNKPPYASPRDAAYDAFLVNMRADAESEHRDDPEPAYALEQLLQTCPGNVLQCDCNAAELLSPYLEGRNPLAGDDPPMDLDTLHYRHVLRRSPRIKELAEKNTKSAALSASAPAPQVRKRKRKTRKADGQDHSLPSQSQSASPEKRRLGEDAASPVARPRKQQRKGGAVDLSGYTDGRGDLVTKNMDWSEQQLLGLKASQSKSTSVSTFRPRKRGAPCGHRREGYQLDRILSHSTVVASSQFTFQSDVRPSQSGFQGGLLPDIPRRRIDELYRQEEGGKALHPYLSKFHPAEFNPRQKLATFFVDRTDQVFMFRSWCASWLEARADEVKEAIDVLVEDEVADERVRLHNSDGSRGPHLPLIIGHHRQSAKTPILSHWHAANQTRVDKFLALSIVQNIIGWVTSVVTDVFPGVAERFLKDAAWHKERYGIEPLFGLFWNFCVNAWFVNDIEFVSTNGERPTRENSRPIAEGDEQGRGSMVFFNQSTMRHGPATGSDTMKIATSKGHSGKTDFGTDANTAFNPHPSARALAPPALALDGSRIVLAAITLTSGSFEVIVPIVNCYLLALFDGRNGYEYDDIWPCWRILLVLYVAQLQIPSTLDVPSSANISLRDVVLLLAWPSTLSVDSLPRSSFSIWTIDNFTSDHGASNTTCARRHLRIVPTSSLPAPFGRLQ
ncbi:hypothetical protein K438DRAFT_1966976 [Mycena galopus ATCC 62051]|nr:hypothetical protein K438DRAFT_1966976 [Mycena galopus ATCC 62051]